MGCDVEEMRCCQLSVVSGQLVRSPWSVVSSPGVSRGPTLQRTTDY